MRIEIILESLKEGVTQSDLSRKYGVPQSLISIWKRDAIDLIHRENNRTPGRRRGGDAANGGIEDVFMRADLELAGRLRVKLTQTIAMLDDLVARARTGDQARPQ